MSFGGYSIFSRGAKWPGLAWKIPTQKKQKTQHKKPPKSVLFGFIFFFAIFHCKSPWWLNKFDLEYFKALLKYESCVKFL